MVADFSRGRPPQQMLEINAVPPRSMPGDGAAYGGEASLALFCLAVDDGNEEVYPALTPLNEVPLLSPVLVIGGSYVEWAQRVEQNGASDELAAEVSGRIERQPLSQKDGDDLRGLFSGLFAHNNNPSAAANLLRGSAWTDSLYDNFLGIAEAGLVQDDRRFMDCFLDEHLTPEAREDFICEALDYGITVRPSGFVIAALEEASALSENERLEKWITLQRRRFADHDDLDWDRVLSCIQNNRLWEDVPLKYRQQIAKDHELFRACLPKGLSVLRIFRRIKQIDHYENGVGPLPIWDVLRGEIVEDTAANDHLPMAFLAGSNIRDETIRNKLIFGLENVQGQAAVAAQLRHHYSVNPGTQQKAAGQTPT